MLIKTARIDDIPRLQPIIDAAFAGTANEGLGQLARGDLLSLGRYYFAEVAGEVLGCGGWSMDEPGTKLVTPGLGHIRNVAVDPRAQGQGVGRALMRHIFTEANNVAITEFLCFSSLEAEAFYQKLGFVVLQRQELSLPNGRKIPMIRMQSSAISPECVGLFAVV